MKNLAFTEALPLVKVTSQIFSMTSYNKQISSKVPEGACGDINTSPFKMHNGGTRPLLKA
jgi:hypothetical protein